MFVVARRLLNGSEQEANAGLKQLMAAMYGINPPQLCCAQTRQAHTFLVPSIQRIHCAVPTACRGIKRAHDAATEKRLVRNATDKCVGLVEVINT
jgi:hypothetical protein